MNSYSAGTIPYFWVRLPLFVFGAEKVAKNAIALVRTMVMSVIIILGIQTPLFGGCAWLAIMLFDMMIFVAPAA
jgi:hypothetical protein